MANDNLDKNGSAIDKPSSDLSYLEKEGIIGKDEEVETIYLAEEEIEKFMQNYLKENPGTEIETRYINQPPIELTQDIEVRWLRPETPEIPPIIIKEVDIVEKEQPPIRIVQKPKCEQEEIKCDPIIIREKPPLLAIPEPKFAYVQNVIKREVKPDREIKVEHIRSESQSSLVKDSRLEYDEQVKSERSIGVGTSKDPHHYSFEEHASIIDYEEEFEHRRSTIEEAHPDDQYRVKHIRPRSVEDEHQLRLYEEKLKQTLYEEYLLRLEREKIEKKLSEQGVFEERLRERSVSQERLSQNRFINSRLSSSRLREEQRLREEEIRDQRLRERLIREEEFRQQFIRERQTQSLDTTASDTSTYKNIKFSKVTDENELKRLNAILNNPNAPSIRNKAEGDKIMSTLAQIDPDQINNHLDDTSNKIRTNYMREDDFYTIRQSNLVDEYSTVNDLDRKPRNRKDFHTSSSSNFSRNYYNKSSSGDLGNNRILRTDSQKRFQDDLRAYELYNNGIKSSLSKLTDSSLYRPSDMSRSGSGIRRHRVTSIKSYYSTNYPNPITEKNVYINRY